MSIYILDFYIFLTENQRSRGWGHWEQLRLDEPVILIILTPPETLRVFYTKIYKMHILARSFAPARITDRQK